MTLQRSYWTDGNQLTLLKHVLPHREPMILLEEVLDFSDNGARTALVIRESSGFYRPELGGVPSWVGLEYMAQSIGAWSGDLLLQKGKPIAIGFLLGSRRYQTQVALFTLGTRLVTDIAVAYAETSGLSSFDCTIRAVHGDDNGGDGGGDGNGGDDGGIVVAQARVNCFRPDDHRPFVRNKSLIGGGA